MTNEFYICTKRGTLHLAVKTHDGRLLTDERDNIDEAKIAWALPKPTSDFKRYCERCFDSAPLLETQPA